jgi:DNA modification methylase
MAYKLKRIGLGIEISPRYEGIIRERLKLNNSRLDHFSPPFEASSRRKT